MVSGAVRSATDRYRPVSSSPPPKFQRFIIDVCRLTGGLKAKRLLEIGSDPDGLFLRLASSHGVSSAVGVDGSAATCWARSPEPESDASLPAVRIRPRPKTSRVAMPSTMRRRTQ